MSPDGARTVRTPTMSLLILAVLGAVIGTRAEISYQGGLTIVREPSSSCSCIENYNPSGPIYNQLGSPYPEKYPGVQIFPNVPATLQNDVGVINPSPVCTCGYARHARPVVLGDPAVLTGDPTLHTGFVDPPEYATPIGLPTTPPTILEPAPDLQTTITQDSPTSHIMKIPRRSESSLTTTMLNYPDSSASPSSYVSTSNSIYSSLPPPPKTFAFPPRSFFYTRPSPVLPSCPATVFYAAAIPAFSAYPPFTCPAYPRRRRLAPVAPPTVTPSPLRPNPAFLPSTLRPTTPDPKDGRNTITGFTSNIPNTNFVNVTGTEKIDPLLTFKLLTAAAAGAESQTVPSPPSPSTDCSMPIPPPVVA